MMYFKRLRNALLGRRTRDDRKQDDDVARVRDLDDYIVRLVKVNLPNFTHGHPTRYTEEERDKIQKELVAIADRIDHANHYRFRDGAMQERKPTEKEDYDRFVKLLSENLRDLWD